MYPKHHPKIVLAIAMGFCLFYSSCNVNVNVVNDNIEINQDQGPNPWTNLNWNNKSENFQFVVVTDRTGGMRPGVFEQGVEKVNLLQPEFVMSVGDLIQGYTEDTVELTRQWEEFDSFVDGLEMPFFYVPGNHDITNKVMEDLWAERYGRTYYHFVYQNVLFLCLNSEEPIADSTGAEVNYHTGDFYLSEKQRNYISETLSDHAEVRWTLVFWHKPVWLYQDSDNPTHQELVPKSGWPEVEELLKQRKHTVFAGHIHRYVHQKRNNSDYVTLATTGGGSALAGPMFGQFDHVLWVTMTDDGPVMANLLLEGIFDEDFTREDIEKHLELTMRHKVMRADTKLDDTKPLESQVLNFTLFNPQDIPAEALVDLPPNSDGITFSQNQFSVAIPPNSAVSLPVDMVIKALVPATGEDDEDAEWSATWDEFRAQHARWTLAYDLENYGKIEVSGNSRLYR